MDNVEVSDRLLKVAAVEMTASGFAEIAPIHLLIALSRVSEEQTSNGDDEPIKALRQEFESLGIEPRRFRRRLRALLPKQGDSPRTTAIHRSQNAKGVLMLADALARASREESSPSHLLRAMFLFLADALVIDRSIQPEPDNSPADDEIPKEL